MYLDRRQTTSIMVLGRRPGYPLWCQGPRRVSFARPDLRLWRPVAGVGPPELRLCALPAWWALDSCSCQWGRT